MNNLEVSTTPEERFDDARYQQECRYTHKNPRNEFNPSHIHAPRPSLITSLTAFLMSRVVSNQRNRLTGGFGGFAHLTNQMLPVGKPKKTFKYSLFWKKHIPQNSIRVPHGIEVSTMTNPSASKIFTPVALFLIAALGMYGMWASSDNGVETGPFNENAISGLAVANPLSPPTLTVTGSGKQITLDIRMANLGSRYEPHAIQVIPNSVDPKIQPISNCPGVDVWNPDSAFTRIGNPCAVFFYLRSGGNERVTFTPSYTIPLYSFRARSLYLDRNSWGVVSSGWTDLKTYQPATVTTTSTPQASTSAPEGPHNTDDPNPSGARSCAGLKNWWWWYNTPHGSFANNDKRILCHNGAFYSPTHTWGGETYHVKECVQKGRYYTKGGRGGSWITGNARNDPSCITSNTRLRIPQDCPTFEMWPQGLSPETWKDERAKWETKCGPAGARIDCGGRAHQCPGGYSFSKDELGCVGMDGKTCACMHTRHGGPEFCKVYPPESPSCPPGSQNCYNAG